jgi:hypothetical protein
MQLQEKLRTNFRNPLVGLAVILFVALACRWVWASQPRSVRWDEPDYLILAQHLAQGQGYQVYRRPELHTPPAAPYLAAAALKLGVPVEQGLLFWHVLAGVALCGLIFGLARDLTGSYRVALLAGMLAAVSGSLAVEPLYWGSMTESIFMAFLFAGLWATWRLLRSGGIGTAALAGVAFGLGYLTRPEGLVWGVLFLLVAVGVALRLRCCWRDVAVYALALGIVVTPYLLYLYRNTGHFMLSGKTGLTAAMSVSIVEEGNAVGNDYGSMLDSSGKEVLWLSNERYEIGLLDVIRADPMGEARRVARNLRRALHLMVSPLLGTAMVLLVVLGLLGEVWDRRRLWAEAFLMASLAPLGVVLLFHVQPRLLVPWVPIALIWGARGVDHLLAWGRETLALAPWPGLRSLRVVWGVLVVVAVLLLGIRQQRVDALNGQGTLVFSHKSAGAWLAKHSAPDSIVMTRDSEIGVYSGRPVVPLPNASWSKVLAYARSHNAVYLVIDSWEMKTVRPQLIDLADPATAPPEVTYLAQFAGPNRTTFVYRIGE